VYGVYGYTWLVAEGVGTKRVALALSLAVFCREADRLAQEFHCRVRAPFHLKLVGKLPHKEVEQRVSFDKGEPASVGSFDHH
jgi:hypothetical protein